MATKFFKCAICGNVIMKCVDSGVTPKCCGSDMVELDPSTSDGAREKHLPVVECGNDGTVNVTVGSVEHPMTPEHHIVFICLETAKGVQIKYLAPTDEPKATFLITPEDKLVAVYSFCNLHGLWKTVEW